MTSRDAHAAIEATFRIERARLIAGLARMTRDVDTAEELAQEALALALNEWPRTGVPAKPAAWLMAVAKRRAIDSIRRDQMRARKHHEIGNETPDAVDPEGQVIAMLGDDLSDELLGLIFAACHPMLPPNARTALTLRIVGGLTTDEIARAFLTSEATVAQRIVRAKKAITKARLTFAVPRGDERAARLRSVLEVVYLIFNEGYAASAGADLIRPALCMEAQRLGRVLAALMPDDAEVLGLLALMELQASRFASRVGADGTLVPLMQQDRKRWDWLLIDRGLRALDKAEALGGGGSYVLQASLAACHARARHAEDTDWPRIAMLYDRLSASVPSPIVSLNRAIAYSMAFGADAGLSMLDAIEGAASIRNYAPLPAARGDFLFRLGRLAEAGREFQAAAVLAGSEPERAHLLMRAQACDQRPGMLGATAGNTTEVDHERDQ